MDTFISIFHHHFSVDLMILMVMNHVFILFSWNLCMGILYNWIIIGMSVTRVLDGGISWNIRESPFGKFRAKLRKHRAWGIFQNAMFDDTRGIQRLLVFKQPKRRKKLANSNCDGTPGTTTMGIGLGELSPTG